MKLMFPPYLLFIRGIRGGRVGQSFLVLKGGKFLKKLSRFVGGEYFKIIYFLVLTNSLCWGKLRIYQATA